MTDDPHRMAPRRRAGGRLAGPGVMADRNGDVALAATRLVTCGPVWATQGPAWAAKIRIKSWVSAPDAHRNVPCRIPPAPRATARQAAADSRKAVVRVSFRDGTYGPV